MSKVLNDKVLIEVIIESEKVTSSGIVAELEGKKKSLNKGKVIEVNKDSQIKKGDIVMYAGEGVEVEVGRILISESNCWYVL